LERGFDRLAREFARGGHGRGFDGRQYLAVGCIVGGLFELPSQHQGLLDQERLQWSVRVEGATSHRVRPPRGTAHYTQQHQAARINYCTLCCGAKGKPYARTSRARFEDDAP
jgi:hypothetical protein